MRRKMKVRFGSCSCSCFDPNEYIDPTNRASQLRDKERCLVPTKVRMHEVGVVLVPSLCLTRGTVQLPGGVDTGAHPDAFTILPVPLALQLAE